MAAQTRKYALLHLLLCLLLIAPRGHGNAYAEIVFRDDASATNPVSIADPVSANGWSYPVPLEVLEDPDDVLRLINRDHPLEKAYPDTSIDKYKMVPVTVRKTNRDFTIRGIANDALREMFAAAELEGIALYVGSAHRTYRSQEVSHYNRVKKMGYDDGIVQMAGASEHQAGLAADVVSAKYTDRFLQEFGNTEEGKWLASNCAQYGFIIRYPADKEEITKVKYEPWHVRYVGVEAATYIMESGLTLEEFTEEWHAALEKYSAQ